MDCSGKSVKKRNQLSVSNSTNTLCSKSTICQQALSTCVPVFVILSCYSLLFIFYSLLLDGDSFSLCRISYFAFLFFLFLFFVIYSTLSFLKRSSILPYSGPFFFLSFFLSFFLIFSLFSLLRSSFLTNQFIDLLLILIIFVFLVYLILRPFIFLSIFFRPRSFLNHSSIFTHLLAHFSSYPLSSHIYFSE